MNDVNLACSVAGPAEDVDAGAAFAVRIRIEPPAGDRLGKACASIRDAGGRELARSDLARGEDGASESGDIELSAPASVGEHTFHAVVLATDDKRALREVAASELRVVVKAHSAHLNVWDVPSAISVGGRFGLKIGLRCSAGCNLGGQRLRILDHDGREAGAVAVMPEPWPGTDALHFAEAELIAPPVVGHHSWQVVTTDWETGLPHGVGSLGLSVNTVPAPEFTVTITTVDSENQTPVAGATVVLHPYRATTGADGIARIKVSKGQYDALISGPRYEPVGITIKVEADVDTTAELDADETWKSEDETFG